MKMCRSIRSQFHVCFLDQQDPVFNQSNHFICVLALAHTKSTQAAQTLKFLLPSSLFPWDLLWILPLTTNMNVYTILQSVLYNCTIVIDFSKIIITFKNRLNSYMPKTHSGAKINDFLVLCIYQTHFRLKLVFIEFN